MSRSILFLTATAVALGGGCTDGGYPDREPTASERAEIESAVRACGLPVRDARWTRIEDGQWEFGFATDESIMRQQPNATTRCVDQVSDDVRIQGLGIAIGYYGT
jgi:hypothetical protein